MSAGTSSREPGSHASSLTPAVVKTRSTSRRKGPSPTTTRRSRWRACGCCLSSCTKCARQQRLVLDHLQAAYRAHNEVLFNVKRPVDDQFCARHCRRKSLGIHTIGNQASPSSRDADGTCKIVINLLRNRDVVRHKGSVKAPDPLMLAVGPVGIAHIPPVLSVHAHRHARQPAQGCNFECCKIAGVQYMGSNLLQQLVNSRV